MVFPRYKPRPHLLDKEDKRFPAPLNPVQLQKLPDLILLSQWKLIQNLQVGVDLILGEQTHRLTMSLTDLSTTRIEWNFFGFLDK